MATRKRSTAKTIVKPDLESLKACTARPIPPEDSPR
jgi:hypothetical protein